MISSVLQELGQGRGPWDQCMCLMITEEAKNQSIPTRYFHTHMFHFFKIHFLVNTIHSSLLSIGYPELDSLMKCMIVSQITQRTFVTQFIFLIDNKSHSLLILHLTFTCQHLTKKLVSFFSELLGCQCVWWLSVPSSFFCISILPTCYIVCLTIKSSEKDPVWHGFSDTVVEILDEVVISARMGSLLYLHTPASKRSGMQSVERCDERSL